ncbi:MAG: GntR family transcriptional regulator [Campylobacterales bacterium]|nr:GntR family transcriptional regulator [Campylobacterales bacterium]
MLDNTSNDALYYQLYKMIKNQIKNKELKAGEKIPSENDYSQKYNINRHTVRQAFQKLKEKGLISSQKGKGNFVANIKIPYSMTGKSNYSSQILDIGFEPSSKIIESGIVPADEDTANDLNIKEGDDVLKLEILRFVDNTPFALYTSFFDGKRFGDLLNYIEDNTSLHKILKEKYNVTTLKRECFFEAVLPTKKEAELLMIPTTFPLLVSNVPSFDENGLPVESGYGKFRSDLAKIKINL